MASDASQAADAGQWRDQVRKQPMLAGDLSAIGCGGGARQRIDSSWRGWA